MAPTQIPIWNSTSTHIPTTDGEESTIDSIINLIKDNMLYVIIGGSIILCFVLICCICICKNCKKRKKAIEEEEHMANNVLFGVGGNTLYRTRTVSNDAIDNKNEVQLSSHNSYSNMEHMENKPKNNISPQQNSIKASSPKNTVPNDILLPTAPLNTTKIKKCDSKTPLTTDNNMDTKGNWNTPIGITDTLNTVQSDYNQPTHHDNNTPNLNTNQIEKLPAINMNDIEMDEEESINSDAETDTQTDNQTDNQDEDENEDSDSYDMYTPVPETENREITLKSNNATNMGLKVIDEQTHNNHTRGRTYQKFIPNDIDANNVQTHQAIKTNDIIPNDINANNIETNETIKTNDIKINDTVIDMNDMEQDFNTLNINDITVENVVDVMSEIDKNESEDEIVTENINEPQSESVYNKTISKDETKNALNALFGARNKNSDEINDKSEQKIDIDNNIVSKDDTKNVLNALFGGRKKNSNEINDKSEQKIENIDSNVASKDDTKNVLNALFGGRKKNSNDNNEQKIENIDSNVASKDDTKNVLNALFGGRKKNANVMDDKTDVIETNEEIRNTETMMETNNMDNNVLDINSVQTRTRTRTVDVQYAEDGEICIGIHDFESTNADEMTVTDGSKYTIIQGGNSDWWYVENDDGAQGWVPSSFLKPIK